MCHVLIIPSWYPSSPEDVRGSFFREQAIALSRRGCRVGVIFPDLHVVRQWRSAVGMITRHRIATDNDSGVPTLRRRCLWWSPSHLPSAKPIFWVRCGMTLYKEYVARHGQPDVIHAHSALYGGVLARAIKRRYGIPYVLTEHSTAYARRLIRPREKRAASRVATSASRRVAVSEPFMQLLQDFFGAEAGNWEVIPNIVNDRFLEPQIRRRDRHQSEHVFLCVALLNEKKAVDNLIRAFEEAFRGDTAVTLRIGGDGPERTRLSQLAGELGVRKQVTFLGHLGREQVITEMEGADSFVLPSRYETFGVVVAEALALGKPVIATRCGGPESIIRPQDGLLVPVDDIQALSGAMDRMRDGISGYNPLEIRNACIERYGEDAITARLKEMYREIAAAAPPLDI